MQHAFLITAYNNFKNLNRLLELLDDSRSEIFLHIDKKVGPLDERTLYPLRKANLHIVPPMDVRWGDVRQIQCTLQLIHYALDYSWEYCHYITESDMPLKTMDELDSVFSAHPGSEYIDFAPENYEFAHYKCNVFHLFPRFTKYRCSVVLKTLNHALAKMQWRLGIRRRNMAYKHGSAYFSITRAFATYIDGYSKEICKTYSNTLGGDEVWLQTLC